MISWMDVWKNKKTEEIVTLVSRIYGSKGNVVIVKGSDGVSVEYMESKFEKLYEPVTIDFHSVKDQIAELCFLSDSFGRLGKVVMKRLDPTYFEVGKLVYISNTAIIKRDSYTYYGGPEHPYKIIWIEKKNSYNYNSVYLEVGIARVGNKTKEADYTFPIYPTRPDPEDAYWFLTRYDKPY